MRPVFRRTVAAAALGLSTLTAGPAAATLVAPNAFEAVDAPTLTVAPFRSAAYTFQWVLPASDFAGVSPGTQLTSIGFRLEAGQPTFAQEVSFAQWNLRLSSSQAAFPGLSGTFADNIGADVVTVRSGALTVPGGGLIGGPGPNPFFDIPFTIPYSYTGGPLLVTLSHTGYAEAASSPRTDAVAVTSGLGNSVGQSGFDEAFGSANFFNFPVTRFGTQSVLAEPGTLLLFGLGLAALGFVRGRRAKPTKAFFAAFGLSTLLAGPAAATVVAPNAFEAVEGPGAISVPLGIQAVTFQWVLPASDFAGIAAGTDLISIGFRLDGGLGSINQALNFAQWNLQLSTPQSPFPTLSSTFADNIGADVVSVRSGPLSIPAGALIGGPGPNPFYDIPFTTPYSYTGGPLLVTLTHTGQGAVFFFNDAVAVGGGLGNSVFQDAFSAVSGTEGFLNLPVTRFGTPRELPAPATLMLFGLGLAGLGFAARRRRRFAN